MQPPCRAVAGVRERAMWRVIAFPVARARHEPFTRSMFYHTNDMMTTSKRDAEDDTMSGRPCGVGQAREVLALVPAIRHWMVGRVERAGAELDLSFRQYAALRAIREGAISPGDLARRWSVTPAVITGIVDRLERRGLVRREVDPRDRRRQLLALTGAGIAASDGIERLLARDLTAQLAVATLEEQIALDRALALLRRTFAALEERAAEEGASARSSRDPSIIRVTGRGCAGGPTRSEDSAAGGTGGKKTTRHRVQGVDPMEQTTQTARDETEAPANPYGGEVGQPLPVVELDVSDPDFMANAYETYAELRDEGPVALVRFSGPRDEAAEESPRAAFFRRESYFVTRYDDVVAALLDPRFSSDFQAQLTPEQRAQAPETPEEFRPLAHSIISLDPPDHTRIRKLVQPSFTGSGMEKMRGSIQRTIDQLLDRAEEEAAARGEEAPNRRMNLVRQLAYPFPVTVISDMLGIPREDREQIRHWTENLLIVDNRRDKAMAEEVRQGLLDFTAYLTDLFKRKRREPGDDMISRMLQIEEGGDVLTEEEVLATVFLMYLAGHVTTVNLVGSAVVALLTHPEQLAKLKADPSLTKNAVEETLRYWGPVDFVGRRTAIESLEIAGTPIPKGGQMTAGLASANHDPEKFANPDAYDITRPDANRHVAFGRGIHVCLGAPLARIEGQIALDTLFRRYPDLRLAVPEEELRWSGSFLRGFREVPLLF